MIRELKKEEYEEFKNGIQESFQKGFEDYFGKTNGIIIPDKDILESYSAKGAHSYVYEENGKILGGCIVNINEETMENHLDILYVCVGVQSKGIGYTIWKAIENLYPNTVAWYTCTPIFDKRNVYFYTKKCGFEIIGETHEFEEGFIGDHAEGMYEFKKIMK